MPRGAQDVFSGSSAAPQSPDRRHARRQLYSPVPGQVGPDPALWPPSAAPQSPDRRHARHQLCSPAPGLVGSGPALAVIRRAAIA
jgi:hypothetical protein